MPSNNKTEQSVQELHNQSFDNDFKVNTVEPVVYNPVTGNLDRMVQPGQTLPTAGLNASMTVAEAVDGTVTTKTLTKTISGVAYVKTVAIDSSDDSVTISAWSAV